VPKKMLVCLALGLACAAHAEDKKPVPTFTNEDLARVSPYRAETGALSTPAATPAPASAAARPHTRAARGEEYWRREAEREESRLRPLRRRLTELRLKIEETRHKPVGAGGKTGRNAASASASLDHLERQLRAVQEEIRDAELRFEERARRAGALPGWLR
jgi:hypothetical protein